METIGVWGGKANNVLQKLGTAGGAKYANAFVLHFGPICIFCTVVAFFLH